VRITSRRGSIVAPVHLDRSLRSGLVFMTLHFQDQVKTNILTVDYTDPKSGTAEFKACAVRVDPIRAGMEAMAGAGVDRLVAARDPETST
jgi:predicted molibdopterin-dependent oxidoreductase YjgC